MVRAEFAILVFIHFRCGDELFLLGDVGGAPYADKSSGYKIIRIFTSFHTKAFYGNGDVVGVAAHNLHILVIPHGLVVDSHGEGLAEPEFGTLCEKCLHPVLILPVEPFLVLQTASLGRAVNHHIRPLYRLLCGVGGLHIKLAELIHLFIPHRKHAAALQKAVYLRAVGKHGTVLVKCHLIDTDPFPVITQKTYQGLSDGAGAHHMYNGHGR